MKKKIGLLYNLMDIFTEGYILPQHNGHHDSINTSPSHTGEDKLTPLANVVLATSEKPAR